MKTKDNINDKLSSEAQINTSCLSAVRQRIFLLDGIKVTDKSFNEKADKFSVYLVKRFGCDIIAKIDFFAPMCGEYWQLKYVAVN